MPDNTSADDTPIVAPNSVSVAVASIIRTATRPGGPFTYDTLAAATGLKARRIKSYVHEGKEPSLSAALSLGVVLGESAMNLIMAQIGYVVRSLDEGDTMRPMQVVAEGMKHFSVIAIAAADDRIDHTEEPLTTAAADALIATILPLSSAGKAS